MTSLAPGATIGILGGGQLARMLTLAAARLGLTCHIYDPAHGPAMQVSAAATVAAWDDTAALTRFARLWMSSPMNSRTSPPPRST